jgi:hypothetical protein
MKLPDVQAPETGSKNFLKIKDGESVRGVFIGEMHVFHTKWIGGKSVPCDNKDPDGKVRFRNNFVYHDAAQDQLVVKIWDFPWSVFEQLKDINSEYPLEETKVKITRSGTMKETTYSILPLVGPKDLLTKDQIAAINGMPLLPLEKKSDAVKEFDTDADTIPF